MGKKQLYLLLAIAGAVIPYYFFFLHVADQGFDLSAFVRAVFATHAASGFTIDLLISSLVFWVAIVARKNAGRGPTPWVFIALNLLVGLSCALPAYLYAVEAKSGRQTW